MPISVQTPHHYSQAAMTRVTHYAGASQPSRIALIGNALRRLAKGLRLSTVMFLSAGAAFLFSLPTDSRMIVEMATQKQCIQYAQRYGTNANDIMNRQQYCLQMDAKECLDYARSFGKVTALVKQEKFATCEDIKYWQDGGIGPDAADRAHPEAMRKCAKEYNKGQGTYSERELRWLQQYVDCMINLKANYRSIEADRNPPPGQAVAVEHANTVSCHDAKFVNLSKEQGKAIQYIIAQKMQIRSGDVVCLTDGLRDATT